MQRKLSGWDLSRVTSINAAVGSCRGVAQFMVRGGRNSSLKDPKDHHWTGRVLEVPQESVDSLLEGQVAAIIKMDVEGNEAEALKGAQKTILRDHPPIMLSAYHRSEDLFSLPLLTEQLAEGGYRWYLRHHPYIPAWETNYYAVPEDS